VRHVIVQAVPNAPISTSKQIADSQHTKYCTFSNTYRLKDTESIPLLFFLDYSKIEAKYIKKKNYAIKDLIEKLQIRIMSRAAGSRAAGSRKQRDKNRRQSRGPEEIRRDLDRRNAANRLRASQLSQRSQPDTSTYQPAPAPNISSSSSSLSSSSSSSSAAAIVDSNPFYEGNDDDRSETNSPIIQRKRLVSPVKNQSVQIHMPKMTQKQIKAKREKARRLSRDPAQIRRDLDNWNAANQRRLSHTSMEEGTSSSYFTAIQNANDDFEDNSTDDDSNDDILDRSVNTSPYLQQLSILTSVATYALVIIVSCIFIKAYYKCSKDILLTYHQYLFIKDLMDIENNDVNRDDGRGDGRLRRPRRIRRTPTGLSVNGLTKEPEFRIRANHVTRHLVHIEPHVDIERRARAMAAVQQHVSNINQSHPLIISDCRKAVYNVERKPKTAICYHNVERRAGALAAVKHHVSNINNNQPSIVDRKDRRILYIEKIFKFDDVLENAVVIVQKRARGIEAVQRHVSNINNNHPPIVDKI
jgi:hypothetical protein